MSERGRYTGVFYIDAGHRLYHPKRRLGAFTKGTHHCFIYSVICAEGRIHKGNEAINSTKMKLKNISRLIVLGWSDLFAEAS